MSFNVAVAQTSERFSEHDRTVLRTDCDVVYGFSECDSTIVQNRTVLRTEMDFQNAMAPSLFRMVAEWPIEERNHSIFAQDGVPKRYCRSQSLENGFLE